MSLVNEMLNELQKDQQKSSPFVQNLSATQQSSNYHLKTLIFVITLLLLCTVFYYYLVPNQTTQNNLKKPFMSNSLESTEGNSSDTSQINVANSIKSRTSVSTNKNKLLAKSNVLLISNQKELPEKTNVLEKQLKSPIQETRLSSEIATKKPVRETATFVAKVPTVVKPIIKLSRRTEASKKLQKILSQWDQQSNLANRTQLENLLNEYNDLNDVWLKTINAIAQKNRSLQKKYLDQALNKFPEQDAFKIIRVKQLTNDKLFDLALAMLQKTNQIDWSQTQYRLAGYLSQKTNNHPQAIQYYNHLLIEDPNLGDVNMALAISLEAINESKLAILKFQRALEDNRLNELQKQFISQRIAAIQG